jgi:hypothetical protein
MTFQVETAMRNLIIVLGVALGSLSPIACAYNPRVVPVHASRADWEILAGRWRGEYTTPASARRGIIDFTLSATGEQAFGDVLMIADGSREPYHRYPPWGPNLGAMNAPFTQLLTIQFVRADRGFITGTIASYWDPDRSCQASATFLGEVKDREIGGTFTSICEDGVRQLRGRWQVKRQAPGAR